MNLEEEAKKYAIEVNKKMGEHANAYENCSRLDFIAGANSKSVQVDKLKFAIEMLYKFRECTFGKGKNVILELEQQLKELEDGK